MIRLAFSTSRPLALAALLLGIVTVLVSPAAAQQKIAVLDVEAVMQSSSRAQAVAKELEALQLEKEAELKAILAERDAAVKRFEDGRLTLSQEKLADLQKEVEDIEIRLRRTQDDAKREFEKRQLDELKEIEAEVMPIINAIGAEFGYTAIFNKFQSGLVYADPTTDITALVVERYNALGTSATDSGSTGN